MIRFSKKLTHRTTITGLTALYLTFAFKAVAGGTEIDIYPTRHAPAIDDQLQEQLKINDIAGNTSLVDDRQWSAQKADTIKDVTDYVPGVITQPRNGAESARLSIRGSGLANVFQGRGLLVLQDGIPINMADGEFEFPTIDPWLIRYAEIYPGANALQYGASNFGGAISFITPTGMSDPGYGARGEGGSFGTLHGQLSAGQAGKGGDIYASATGFTQDGFRDHNNQDTSRLNANAGWQLNDEASSRVYVSHTHSDAEIPGAISLAEIGRDPRLANPANLANNYQRNLDITRIADKIAWASGDDRIDASVFYTYRSLDNPVTTYEIQHNNDVGLQLKYTRILGLNQLLAGLNSYYGNADEVRYRNLDAVPGRHILDRNLYAATNEAYAQYEQHLAEKLYAIAGAQGSLANRDIHQGFPTVASQNEQYSGFSPRIGLRYDIAYETQAFANLSRSFEPPTFGELSGGNSPGFNQLRAQRATTAEIGARALWDGIHIQAAYYHGWVRNEFVNYQFTDGSTATINADYSKRDGIELGGEGDLRRNLFVGKDSLGMRAAYTFSRFTLDHDALYGNNTLPGVPEHFLRAELLYRHPSGVSFGPNVEWSPTPSPVDLTNTLYTDAYALLGARAFWENEDKRVNLYVEASNLTDKSYVATSNVVPNASGRDGRYFYPGEGRAFYAGFRWKL